LRLRRIEFNVPKRRPLRFVLQEFSGFGELLCIVAAWAVGLAALWSEHAGRDHNAAADNVAANGNRPASTAFFD
jgi:hypothetical protein